MALKDDKWKDSTRKTDSSMISFTEHFVRSNTISVPHGPAAPASRSQEKPTFLRADSGHATRLKSFDLDVYWKEFQVIKESAAEAPINETSPVDEASLDANALDSYDEEKEWLVQAGLNDVASQLQDLQIVDIANVKLETSKLNFTNQQTGAVVRRVTRANNAIQKWKAKTSGLQTPGREESGGSAEAGSSAGAGGSAGSGDGTSSPSSPSQSSARFNLDLSAENLGELVLTPSSDTMNDDEEDYLIFSHETDAARDFVTLKSDPVGLSMICDFSPEDCNRLHRIALIELTAVLDKFNVSVRPLRNRKSKKISAGAADYHILGVPLTVLLERDRVTDPKLRIPIFITQICKFLEANALEKEGIFRVPGNSAKLKKLREEMESGPISQFSWEGRSVNDAATMLKQFLRELPVPLLTFEYLSLFTAAENIKSRKLQLKAFNLLLILLPAAHRDVLWRLLGLFNKVIDHEEKNKMGVNNVAMIVAPNLFCKLEQSSGNAEAEVKFAAGSSHSVRFLITFSPILFAVPMHIARQLRHLTEAESGKSGKKVKTAKDVQKILKKEAKKDKQLPECRSMDGCRLLDGIDGPVNESATGCVIKVLSPEYPKISMAMEIQEGITTLGVLEIFRKRQAGSTGNETDNELSGSEDLPSDRSSQHLIPSPVSSRHQSPRSSISLQSDPRQYRSRTGSVSLAETVSHICHLAEADLYEVGGNVHERKLRADFDIMAIRKHNPCGQWVIRKRHKPTSTS